MSLTALIHNMTADGGVSVHRAHDLLEGMRVYHIARWRVRTDSDR